MESKGWGKLFLGLYLAVSLFFSGALPAQEYYRWVDEKGAVHFTDNLYSIPEKYRDKAEKRFQLPSREPTAPVSESSSGESHPRQFVVPFTREGNAIIVEGIVNGGGSVKFILDTGASLTIIPWVEAQKLGIDPERGDPILLGGVGGSVVVPQAEIGSIDLGGAQVRNLQVAIHPGFGNRGLLGMDFLSDFRIDINHAKNQLTLEAQPRPHEGHSFEWWQQKFRFWYMAKKGVEQFNSNARTQSQRELGEKMRQIVEKEINNLEARASQAGIPREYRQ